MELTPLKYFVKLAEVLSFTDAAKELFITQSTLSLSIKQLEEDLGVRLFDRVGKKVYLTEAGKDFLDHSRKAIEEVEYGMQHLKEMQHAYAGKLRIGLIYSLFPLLNICVLDFTRTFPRAELSIVYSHSVFELVELIKANKLDFAMSYNPLERNAQTDATEHACFPLCVIAHRSHPVAIRKHISLSDLSGFPLILLDKELYTRKIIDRMLLQYKVKVKPQIEVNSTPLLLEMIRTGHWISILSQDVTVNSPDLKAVPIKEKAEMMHVSLLSMRGKRRSVLAEKFLEIWKDEIQKLKDLYVRGTEEVAELSE
ncbi:MAG: LysR family transcriptional regulator [Paraprevotella sp.]|nr:LysR family transcriptional regulator [Paraprevotella sp.]